MKVMRVFFFFAHNNIMESGYFNYHAKIRKLIDEGQLEYYEALESYHDISPCIVFYFKKAPPLPVREHKWCDYIDILANVPCKKNEINLTF